MRKTIFGKILVIVVLVFFVSNILTGVLVISFFGNYAQNQRLQALKNVAPQIAELTYTIYADSRVTNPEYVDMYNVIYQRNIDSISQISESEIIVTTKSGRIFASSQTAVLGEKAIIAHSELESALRGKVDQSVGTLDNIFEEKRLIVSYPIMHDNEVFGVIFLSSAMPDIGRDKLTIFRLFVIISSIVLLVAAAVIYAMSKRISKPLNKLNMAAKEIASGKFDTTVEVVGDDEISELSKTFNYMTSSLQQLDSTQKNFIANASHELRTPITTISGFLEKILDGTIDDEKKQKEYLSISYNESKRLARLVSDMLDISKMSLGKFTVTKSNFDLAELLRLSVIKFSDALDEKFLDINIDFSSDKINVFADKDAISRVITNLFDNAIKFSDMNTIIGIQVVTKGDKAFVAVSNDGVGIDPEDISHVFERFYKSDKSRNNKRGTGLGLHIVQNILSLHDETIAVKSVALEGNEYSFSQTHPARRTTFLFTLKLSQNFN